MEFADITEIAAISVICYLAAQALKATSLDSKWLPVIAGALGGVLGIASMFLMPGFPAADVITATAIGIVSGLAATGANQLYRQLRQEKCVCPEAEADAEEAQEEQEAQ